MFLGFIRSFTISIKSLRQDFGRPKLAGYFSFPRAAWECSAGALRHE